MCVVEKVDGVVPVHSQNGNHLQDWPLLFMQRRTLIISELESKGALEAPLTKQIENLETEIGLR